MAFTPKPPPQGPAVQTSAAPTGGAFTPKTPPQTAVQTQAAPSGGGVFTPKPPPGSVGGKGGVWPPAKSGGGGIMGALGGAGHWIADKAGLAAHDIKGIPGGIYGLGKLEVQALGADASMAVNHPLRTQSMSSFMHGNQNPASHALGQNLAAQGRGAVQSLQHPLRDPFQTGLTVAALVSGGASLAARGAAVGRAAAAGEGVAPVFRAAISRPPVAPRLLSVGDQGAQMPLHPSNSPAFRAVQAGYDKALQAGLDSPAQGPLASRIAPRIAAHAQNRIAGSTAETARFQQRMAAVPAQLLTNAAKRLAPTGGRVPGSTALKFQRVQQAALELTSVNTKPEVAAAYHAAQAAKGVNPALNTAVSQLYKQVADAKMLTADAKGNVVVNAADHPALATADAALAKVQGLGDATLVAHGVRTPEALAARVNAPGLIRDESAQPGRGFASYATSEGKSPTSPVAGARGPIVGDVRTPITGKEFTGKGIEQGMVPKDVTGQAARHFQQIQRFANTSNLRALIAKTGNDTRQTNRDVLIKVPGADHAKIPTSIEALLGKKTLTTDDAAGIHAALEAYKQDLVPGLKDQFAGDKATALGELAPAGHKWVHQNALGDLAKAQRGSSGKFMRGLDNLNSAVTAQTVYYKIGHVGTRALTNASTNIIQGSANPFETVKSFGLWKQLSDEQRLQAMAASGQHGISAMPHAGTSLVARGATVGANFWARRFDAPFRFNSIAYEARKAGYDTPAKFTQMLHDMQNQQGLPAAEQAKLQGIAKNANREGIAYDRLNATERNFISRGLWFYNWLKGSTMFLGHTALEHPGKMAGLGTAGVYGRQQQQAQLGTQPSYAYGNFKLGGDAAHPTVADWSTFSPFATPASIGDVVAHPSMAAGFLNPGVGALARLSFGLNAHGGKSKSPVLDALTSVFAPTPEQQILTGFLGRNASQAKKMYPRSPDWFGTRDAVIRALVGPGMPRTENAQAAHTAAAREKSGR
jgi:hypothetical protein